MRKSRMTPPRLLVAASAVLLVLWFALPGVHRAALAVEAGAGGRSPTYAGEPVYQLAPGPYLVIDTPRPNVFVPRSFLIAGWAVDSSHGAGTGVDAVHVYADLGTSQQRFLGGAQYGIDRPDVAAAFRDDRFRPSGWQLDMAAAGIQLPPGPHTIHVAARRMGATNAWIWQSVSVQVSDTEPRITIDSPAPGTTIRGGFVVAGWAIDLVSQSGPGMDVVHVYADPGTSQSRFLGGAPVNRSRPDVDQVFNGGGRFSNSGWRLDVSAVLTPGQHIIGVAAHSTVSGQWTWSTVLVTVPVPRTDVRVSIDAPVVSPRMCATSFDVSGWAIDLGATTNTGIDAVHVYADPGTPSSRFIGGATLGGDRPDVAAVFGGSQFRPSGWSIHSSQPLSPGQHVIGVAVRSTVSGNWTWFTKVVTVTSPGPKNGFMAIDNPVHLGNQPLPVTISGWALDLGSNTGSGVEWVHVYADFGVPGKTRFLGGAMVGLPRPDVAQAFDSQCYATSGFILQTTGLEPGRHVLTIVAARGPGEAPDVVAAGTREFVQSPQPSWTEKSDLRVQNASTNESTIVFEYFDTAGAPIAGAGAAHEHVGQGIWRAAAVRDNPNLPAGFQGTATVSSDQPLGLAHLLQVNRGVTSHALRTGTGDGSPTVHVPALVAASPEFSRVLITNLSSTNPACVRVRFIPESGAAIVDQGAMDSCPGGGWYVPPRGSLLRDLQDLQRGGVIPPGFRGSAVVEQLSGTDAPLVATVDLWRDGQAAFAGYNAGTPGDGTVYLPVTTGTSGAWSQSTVTVQNVTNTNVTVNAFCDNGSITLAPGQSKTLGLGNCPNGTFLAATGYIQAVVVLRGDSGEMAAYEAVPDSQTTGTLWLPYLAADDSAPYTAGATWSTETWAKRIGGTFGSSTIQFFTQDNTCGTQSGTLISPDVYRFTGIGCEGVSTASGRLTGTGGTYAAVTVVVSGGNPVAAYTAIKTP